MLQLRDDLILVLDKDGKQLLVREPESGSVFEFGEQEAFLIEALREPYDPAELMAAFNARFGVNDGIYELQELLDILADWGLLAALPNGPAPYKGRSSKVNESILPTQPPSTPAHVRVEEDEQGDDEVEIQRKNRWHLFRPEGLLDVLDRFLSPLRRLVWLIPILVLYSIAGIWFNRHLVANSIVMAELQFGLVGRLFFVMLTENLVVQLSRGVVARHYGLRIPSFGVTLAFGLLPRFNTQIILTSGLAKPERLWLISTAQLARLVLIGIGITLWLVTKSSGSLLATIGTELAFISAVGFLFDANPFWEGYDAYRLLSVLMGVPNLRQRAKNSLRALFTGHPKAVAKYSKDSWILVLYAVVSMAFPVFLVAYFAIGPALWLESNFQGAGVALFLLIITYVVHFFLRRRARSRNEAAQRRIGVAPTQGQEVQGPFARVQVARETAVLGQGSTGSRYSREVKDKRLRYLVIALLIAILFLPYSYETGGTAKISPIAQHEIHAETDGVIEQVHYRGGEWVSQGTVIAEMANHRQKRDVLATRAAIQSKERDIDRLRSTPSIESIRLAEEQLATARLQLRYSAEEADRIEKLFAKGMISTQSFDNAKKQRDLDRQTIEERRASLEALKTQINPNEIASAEAELQKLREDLTFYEEQLRRTYLSMPIAGRIATIELQNLRNKYLEEGQLFCQVEDTREVRVEIAVPEAEIYEVTVGDPVRLKTWAEPGRIFNGVVTEIAPQATGETYGNVVMVIAILPNADLALKTGMTGYAKIQGNDTRVGAAFTRALVRFFLIEIWSWLP